MAVFTHVLLYGTRVNGMMPGPRSKGKAEGLSQGADLLYIAGEKMVDSGTLGYPLGAVQACLPFLVFLWYKMQRGSSRKMTISRVSAVDRMRGRACENE